MSFPFNTGARRRSRMDAMKTTTPPSCPFHAGATNAAPASHPPGTWPPGPPPGLTGWHLLRQMSRDLLGTLSRGRRDHGDLVHLPIWPEHHVMVIDPQLVKAPVAAIPAGMSNTEALGRVLYTQYIYYFQAAGLVLLVAMIGAIVLTLRERKGIKRQDVPTQNARTKEAAMAVKQVPSRAGVPEEMA